MAELVRPSFQSASFGRRARALGFLAGLASLAAVTAAQASQIVTLEMKPVGGVEQKLADALTSVLAVELGRIDGVSVVSQFEVRSLLEHESNKQALGCDDTTCMTEIASAMGAELLLGSTLSRVGHDWVVNLSLIDARNAKVVRRSTGKSAGSSPAAAESAVVDAVLALFRDGLPPALQGPASLSRRGFQALVVAFAKVVLESSPQWQALRKRIIFDLVNTELDYDAEPKLNMLDLAIRRGASEVETRGMWAKDGADFERYLAARSRWWVVGHDLNRVKEIRTRSRERGSVPSPRPLRFEDPEPIERPSSDDVARLHKGLKAPRALVQKALTLLETNKLEPFVALWNSSGNYSAKRAFESYAEQKQRRRQKCEMVPLHAVRPEQNSSAIERFDKEKQVSVLLRCSRDGVPYGDDTVWLKQENGDWRISGW